MSSDPSTNLGTIDSLQLASPGKHAYLKFVVSGTAGKQIISAKLKLNVGSDGTVDGPAIYSTSNSWTETGITYNNRPAAVGSVIKDLGAMSARTQYEIDVTSKVLGDGTLSFLIQGTSTDRLLIGAREGGSGAVLEVQYQ